MRKENSEIRRLGVMSESIHNACAIYKQKFLKWAFLDAFAIKHIMYKINFLFF